VFEDEVSDEDEEDLEEDQGQNLNEIEEPTDDLELAWENLDVARLIFSKQSEKEYILQLADVHLSLGDVSLESGTDF
jgi:HAT1-interacting factor 1